MQFPELYGIILDYRFYLSAGLYIIMITIVKYQTFTVKSIEKCTTMQAMGNNGLKPVVL